MNYFSEYESHFNYKFNQDDEQFVEQVLAYFGFQDLDQEFKRKYVYVFNKWEV